MPILAKPLLVGTLRPPKAAEPVKSLKILKHEPFS